MKEHAELHRKYRPDNLDDVVGQAAAVKMLKSFKAVPHVLLFTGAPGTGKTTLARVMAGRVGCDINQVLDFAEVNCGVVDSAIDTVREIGHQMSGAPLAGKARVWILDEIQAFGRFKYAQEGLLKILEETPPHVYFFLCTTDPRKIIAAVRSRCTEIPVKPIPPKELRGLLADVASKERVKVSSELLDKIVNNAAGSARNALKELGRVIGIEDDEERIEAVGPAVAERAAFDLVKALIPFRGRPVWKDVAAVLTDIADEEPEGLRHMVLASARTTLLKTGNPNCYTVIDCLREPLFDANSGRAILAARCFEIVSLWK